MLMSSILGENLFDEFFEDFARPAKRPVKYQVPSVMRTDVKESNTGYELHIDLPGYKKEDVKAELKDGNLTITATSNVENDKKDENGRFIRRERFYGNCSRSFYVGEHVEQTDIKAKFEDGILKIFVPKKEAKPVVEEKKYITIEG
ncbi:MAG: Hsp20/alpha crystallin family protein [bacterium]|nr:Hsp20/alpha crystallin family protein [bacterium]